MRKPLKIALAAMTLVSSSAFAQYAEHPVFRGQTPGSPVAAPASTSASTGSSVSSNTAVSPSMADFFRWSDLGSRNSSAR